MNAARRLMAVTLGRRLPRWRGRLTLKGIAKPITIRRDQWGVPYIEAQSDDDLWFGLGFCHGQDRGAQADLIRRVVRGELSEMLGPEALPLDRLARRLGCFHAAKKQLETMDEDLQRQLDAYARGINAGIARGGRRPHELALVRARPGRWEAADCQAFTAFLCFALAANWDAELVRLSILEQDGPEALAALDAEYPDWLPTACPPGATAQPAIDGLRDEIAALSQSLQLGGGSNAWAIAGDRTRTGRPILANDPHMMPAAPCQFYLAYLATPQWATAGATFVGVPLMGSGHNGTIAWGITAAHADITDLFIEEIGPDKRSLRTEDGFEACDLRHEVIKVKGQDDPVIETVLVGPRGPIISPALEHCTRAISISGSWLKTRPYRGLYSAHLARSGQELRDAFRAGSTSTVAFVYAEAEGSIGWQLAIEAPRRRAGGGYLPLPGWDSRFGWERDCVPFDMLPSVTTPPSGFVATANNQPAAEVDTPFLGRDWLDGYRQARICQTLSTRRDWDVASTMTLQRDFHCQPWSEMREHILSITPHSPQVERALALLTPWDASLDPDSPAASIYQFFVTGLIRRVVSRLAPNSCKIALGQGFTPLIPHNLMATRRLSHLVRLLNEQPERVLEEGWQQAIGDELHKAVLQLETSYGLDSDAWAWGRVRTLTLSHPFGAKRPLAAIFNVAQVRCGGDSSTIHQAGVDIINPLAPPWSIPSCRVVIDVGHWDNSRYVLLGGQSGNPCSPHYQDQVPLWEKGQALPIGWSQAARDKLAKHTLTLSPKH